MERRTFTVDGKDVEFVIASDVDAVVEELQANLDGQMARAEMAEADLARVTAELEKANNPTWTEEQKNDSHDRARRMGLL